jgi:predicted lipoprotein with Yx(FWY)xxD motif
MMTRSMNLVRGVSLLCLSALGGIAYAQPVAREGRLTTPAGLTLYTFANDAMGSGKSACYPPCSNLHPPYLLEQGASPTGELSVVERSDGAKQWAHKGKPLYRWIYDEKPGDAGADGMNRGIWQIAKP